MATDPGFVRTILEILRSHDIVEFTEEGLTGLLMAPDTFNALGTFINRERLPINRLQLFRNCVEPPTAGNLVDQAREMGSELVGKVDRLGAEEESYLATLGAFAVEAVGEGDIERFEVRVPEARREEFRENAWATLMIRKIMRGERR